MRTFRFHTVDVFTEKRFGGNPLAVFSDANGLSEVEMQALANEFNLSETAFVLQSREDHCHARVRIFNRTSEMPFAGHPNVGTAYVLASEGTIASNAMRFEELAGFVDVEVIRDGDGTVTGARIAAPQPLSVGMVFAPETIAACVDLKASDLVLTVHPPICASVGMPYVIAEVTPSALDLAMPNLTEFAKTLSRFPSLQGRLSLHLYAKSISGIRARMFAPLAGTIEDPATGSANTALAALLLLRTNLTRASYIVLQGEKMGRPSLLNVTAEKISAEIRATVGGSCVPVLRGEISL